MHTHTKYTPYPTVKLDKREWADKSATVAPRWVSTDLRDGNQALANPMWIEQKIAYFKALVEFGFKEIEVAYPSASQTELTEILESLRSLENRMYGPRAFFSVLRALNE